MSFQQSVRDIIAQPVQVPFVALNGRTYPYTSDFLVYFRPHGNTTGPVPSPLLVEVKPQDELQARWHEMKPKLKAMVRYARQQGWRFQIHDENRIRDQTLNNIAFLQRYKRMAIPTALIEAIQHRLKSYGKIPVHALIENIGEAMPIEPAHLWHLIATHILYCDMAKPLAESTVLWAANGE